MDFAVIDNNVNPMNPSGGRGQGFVEALAGWTPGKNYGFVRFQELTARRNDLLRCRGLILSGSALDFALPDNRFDRNVYETMIPEFQLMHDFQGPVLGICFGHQLMALADDFDRARTDFGGLRVRNMPSPPGEHSVLSLRLSSPLRFLDQQELWVQFHHKQEVVLSDAFLKYFQLIAGSEQCPVQVMQHRFRDWFGVQFHPEIGKQSRAGVIDRHEAAVTDGRILLQAFVRYCLR